MHNRIYLENVWETQMIWDHSILYYFTVTCCCYLQTQNSFVNCEGLLFAYWSNGGSNQ